MTDTNPKITIACTVIILIAVGVCTWLILSPPEPNCSESIEILSVGYINGFHKNNATSIQDWLCTSNVVVIDGRRHGDIWFNVYDCPMGFATCGTCAIRRKVCRSDQS